MNETIELKDNNRIEREISASWNEYKVARKGNIGIITINNALTSEYDYFGLDYKTLGASLEALEQEEEINAIVLDINSPGGALSGLSDFVESVKACNKPIYAFTSGHICSASYAIASACRKIYAVKSAQIGSIGAYMSWTDDSKAMEKMGIEEISFYGQNSELKNLDPKTEEGKKYYQEEINKCEDMFLEMVAENRNTTKDEILKNFGHGQVFFAEDAKKRGMIDEIVKSFDDFMEIIGEIAMSKEINDKVMAKSVEEIDAKLLESIKNEAKAEILKENELKAKELADKAVAEERMRITSLEKYASLNNPEINAMVEKAKTEGTSAEEFKALFAEKAFELLKNEPKAETKTSVNLANEVKDGAMLAGVVNNDVNKGEKSAQEKGSDLFESLNAKLSRK